MKGFTKLATKERARERERERAIECKVVGDGEVSCSKFTHMLLCYIIHSPLQREGEGA